MSALAGSIGATQADRDRVFYPALAILISATGFAGFSFTYFGPIIGGSYPPAGAALHLHGWSFFLWYLLLPLQAVLIGKRKHRLHMSLGRLSVGLVVVMTLTGLLVLTVRVEEAMRNGAPQVWLVYGPLILSNLILFVSFYAAGVRGDRGASPLTSQPRDGAASSFQAPLSSRSARRGISFAI